MSKINISEELKNKIIDLYVNQNYTRVQIRKELNLDFGDSVVLRILKENNIKIRTNNGAQKGGRKKLFVDKKTQEQIIEKYQIGWGLERIVRELKLSFGSDKVKSILIDNNIHIRNVKEASLTREMPDLRKFTINDDYNFESHNGAWILGFIAADGYLPKNNGTQNKVVITLARKDEDILHLIAKELEYTGTVKRFNSSKGFPCSSLYFTSKKLRKAIESYGIVNNKTFLLKQLPKNLPEEYYIDFIRGFFDGDGCIFEPKDKKISTSLVCASEDFLSSIKNYLYKTLNVHNVNISSCTKINKIYEIKYSVKDSFIIGKAFYDNSYLALPRKKQHFFEILKKYS